MSDLLTIIALITIAAIWGYLIVRGLRRKEFRKRGYWGWFKKDSDPVDFWLYVGMCFVEFAACAYILTLLVKKFG